MKCIVKGCLNHHGEGMFVGDLCNPCYNMLVSGKVAPSYAWFVREISDSKTECDKLKQVVDMQKAWIEDSIKENYEKGEVVVTTNESGDCVAVTRQDDDHKVIKVIWQKK